MKSKMKLTSKQIRQFKNGEISMCENCYCMTKSILRVNRLICGKCGGEK